jgi:hypothetical protein
MDTPRLPLRGQRFNDGWMRISIAPALIEGVTQFCLIQGTVVISSHPTLKQAVDARRNLVLPLPEDRPAPNTVTMAVQRGYHEPHPLPLPLFGQRDTPHDSPFSHRAEHAAEHKVQFAPYSHSRFKRLPSFLSRTAYEKAYVVPSDRRKYQGRSVQMTEK